MEPIRIPRPPKEAFNKHRPVSDLIRSQVELFRHVENKLSLEQRSALPQGHIRTEHEAAQYISAMTELLRGLPAAAAPPRPAPIVMPVRARRAPARGISIAAAGGPGSTKKTSRPRKTNKGKKG